MQVCGCKLSRLLAAVLLLTPVVALPSQVKTATQRIYLSIEKGPLSSVLEQLANQTGLQIGTQPNVRKSTTRSIGSFKGDATVDEALSALLKDTDLWYTWQDPHTIRIYAKETRPPRPEAGLSEVTVTGSRILEEEAPAPIKVYSQRRIRDLGASSVADVSRYLSQQPYSFGSGHLQNGSQFFQMRGLGFDTTLVLINGRRVPPSANSIEFNAVDLNNVPIISVDRIEVMSESASAIYGADAIGGVVNVILKNRVDRPEIYLHYGQADGGGLQRRVSTSLGVTTDDLKSALVLDYFETTALMGNERALWRDQNYSRFGGRDYRVSTTNPGNVYSVGAQPLPGLSSWHAAVPREAEGVLTPADFIATEGVTNLESASSDWSITPQSRRTSAYGTAEYSLTDTHSLFGEILAVNSDVTTLRPFPSVTRQLVPASNPFNPFGVPVAVDYSFTGTDRISYLYETELLRVVGGTRGKIGSWEWEIAGIGHREKGISTMHGALDPARITAAINSDNPDTALNLFSDGPAGDPELLSSLIGRAQSVSSAFASAQLSAFIKGHLLSIGERNAELVVGAEWRHDEAEFLESGKRVDEGRQIASAFSEVRLPLLDDLTLTMAGRGDRYGGGKSVVNPQYGLIWRPRQDWQLSATYATSFRPPSLFELNVPTAQPSVPIVDPLRGGEVSNVELTVGGNRDLQAVTAQSVTAGFIFSPSEGLHFRGRYWRVMMDDRILVPNYQELLKLDSALSARVARDAPSAEDLQRGWAGRVSSIDLTRLNYGDLETSGIDFDALCVISRPWGSLQFDLALTWVDEYVSHDMNSVLPENRVGIADINGTIPKWRTVGTLALDYGDFGASTTMTFVPSYQDADFAAGPLDRRIGSQFLADLQIWTELRVEGSALLDGSILTCGARNALNRAPEFAHAGAALGYDASQSELTRRFVYCRLSKSF